MDVARCHNKHAATFVKQQVLNGRGGQHYAQFGQVVGQALRERRIGALSQQHDRARRARELARFSIVDFAKSASLFHRSNHNGKRLARTMLALAQCGKSRLISSVAHQVIPAQALNGNDTAFRNQLCSTMEDPVGFLDVFRPGNAFERKAVRGARFNPANFRAALKARVGLCMKAPVGGVGVLFLACWAHSKLRHRCFGAVVRQLAHDGKARTAVSAVDEGIMVATIIRVEQLFHASVARCQIGRNKRGFVLLRRIGKANLESIEPLHRNFRNLDFAYLRSSGLFFRKSQHKPVER